MDKPLMVPGAAALLTKPRLTEPYLYGALLVRISKLPRNIAVLKEKCNIIYYLFI